MTIFERMPPYRVASEPYVWTVEATAKGPLGPVAMASTVRAFDETSAVETFAARLQGEGFEVIGETRAVKRPR